MSSEPSTRLSVWATASEKPPAPKGPAEPRGCLPTFLVAVLMFSIALSGGIALAAVEGGPAPVVHVAGPVSIQPLPGWEFVSRSDDGNSVLLSQGSGSLLIEVVEGAWSPADLLEATFESWEADPEAQLTTGVRESVETAPGILGVRAPYGGTFPGIEYPVEGELTVVEGGGVPVIFDAWASEGELSLVIDEIRQMIAGTTYQ